MAPKIQRSNANYILQQLYADENTAIKNEKQKNCTQYFGIMELNMK